MKGGGRNRALVLGHWAGDRSSRSGPQSPRTKRGFTLIEALVSVVLLSVGVVSATMALGQMTKSEAYMQEGERMRRLADKKLEALVATGDYEFVTSGDFSEENDDRYDFTASLEPTGTENLNVVRVTVTRKDRKDDEGVEASQVIFIPPTNTGGQMP
jgi:prepilin-type N-terminal cleavage/methylation domain-containing protein